MCFCYQGEGQDITEDEEAEENDVMPDDVIMEHANYMRPENKEWPLGEPRGIPLRILKLRLILTFSLFSGS